MYFVLVKGKWRRCVGILGVCSSQCHLRKEPFTHSFDADYDTNFKICMANCNMAKFPVEIDDRSNVIKISKMFCIAMEPRPCIS